VVKRKRRSTWLSKGFKLLLLVLVAVGVWHSFKPLPEGISYAGELRPALGVQFLADLTFLDAAGERHSEQQIFDELFAMIDAAQRFVLVDMFLFNAAQGRVREEHRALASELTSRLILQQERYPDMQILLITDPINSVYGGLEPENLSRLRQANISVTETKLTPLRDSNPIYSSIWRTFLAVWGNGLGEALPNPVGEGRVSVRSYLTLMNFKANHRKVAITDQGDAYTGQSPRRQQRPRQCGFTIFRPGCGRSAGIRGCCVKNVWRPFACYRNSHGNRFGRIGSELNSASGNRRRY